MHLVHLSQVADCCWGDRSKQNKHLDLEEDKDVEIEVDNGEDDSVDNGDDGGADDCADDGDIDNDADNGEDDSVGNGDHGGDDDGAEKLLVHLSQVADCCLADRIKKNKHLILEQDNDVDDGADNGEDDSVDNGDDGGADDGAEKHLVHLSQVADFCWAVISKQKEHLVSDKDDDVEDDAED
eukprot:9810786-Ditylum_brightwellii.AAC.1